MLPTKFDCEKPFRLIIEVPSLLLRAETDSPILAMYLATFGIGGNQCNLVGDNREVVLGTPPPRHVEGATWGEALFLPAPLCHAASRFLFGEDGERARAITAAVVGNSRGFYLYLTSLGIVFSSKDIIEFLSTRLEGGLLFSAGEMFSLDRSSATRGGDVRRIAIDYVVAQRRYAGLPERDQLKFAVLHVCRDWGINLRCKSLPGMPRGSFLTWVEKQVTGNAKGTASGNEPQYLDDPQYLAELARLEANLARLEASESPDSSQAEIKDVHNVMTAVPRWLLEAAGIGQ